MCGWGRTQKVDPGPGYGAQLLERRQKDSNVQWKRLQTVLLYQALLPVFSLSAPPWKWQYLIHNSFIHKRKEKDIAYIHTTREKAFHFLLKDKTTQVTQTQHDHRVYIIYIAKQKKQRERFWFVDMAVEPEASTTPQLALADTDINWHRFLFLFWVPFWFLLVVVCLFEWVRFPLVILVQFRASF